MTKQPTNEEPGRQAQDPEKDAPNSRTWSENTGAFSDIAERSFDGIVTSDMEKIVTYVNHAYAEMHGYSAKEMIGMKVEDFHNLRTKKNIDENNVAGNQVIKQGSWLGELEHIRKDGTPFPTYHSVTLLKDNDGKPKGVLTICKDISQQKLEHQRMQESEEKYRTLFERANEAILIFDLETGRILDANKQAERLFGRQRREIVRMHQVELHPPHQAEYYRDLFLEHVRRGQGLEEKGEILEKNGNIIPVSINTSVISILGKQVLLCLFRDLIKEQSLSELKDKLEKNELIRRAKGILMDRYNISEKESLQRLQKESRKQRKKMKEIAQAIISSRSILD